MGKNACFLHLLLKVYCILDYLNLWHNATTVSGVWMIQLMQGQTQKEHHVQTEMTRDTDRTWQASLMVKPY